MKKICPEKSFVHSIKTGNSRRFLEFLDKGVEVNTRDEIGWTPLFYAVNAGDVPMVKELLRRGANTTVTDNSGWTALGHAQLDGNVKICDVLRKH